MAEALAADIGKNLAVDAAKALTQLVAARPLEEIRLACSFKDQLRKLNRKFQYIHAFLEDLGSAKSEQPLELVNRWLQNVKDAVYSAEDFMDEYAYEILKRKVEQSSGSAKSSRKSSNVLKRISNHVCKKTKRISFRFEMTHKVGEILAMFHQLEKEAFVFGLKLGKLATIARLSDNVSEYASILQQVREHARADESEFIGRKLDEEKLVQMLCSPNNKGRDLPINAIVGMGGVGKTTLARRLYDNEQVVKKFFYKQIWICVSENFDIIKILREMVENLTGNCNLTNTEAIIRQLQEELRGSKFLLVLDDVWNNNEDLWDSLKHSLQRIEGSIGSVVLITTRSNDVVTKAGAESHLLTELSEESWALFKHQFKINKALLNVPCFESAGRRIVEKCKGVPLAIKMIGRSLQPKKNLYEWEEIEKSELWQLQYAKNHILPSLLLSFYRLPSMSLKQCFAFCAIFPKHFLMEKGDLIALWSAQGFLHRPQTSNSIMEDTGAEVIEILMENLFLQGEESQRTGQILTFKMHDLVHDLALYVSKKDLLVWKEECKPNSAFEGRHLVGKFRKTFPGLPAEVTTSKLRTLSLWTNFPLDLFLARYLRTLIMDGIGLKWLPNTIGQLKLLRYIDLSNNPILKLPESITILYQLQTLKLMGCKQLTELPTELNKLVNLRHIPTTQCWVFASKGLHQLTSLQTLPDLALRGGQGWTIDELGPLHEIRYVLSISGLEHVKSKDEAREAYVGRKAKISQLRLIWSDNRVASVINNDEEVLDALEPHPNITALVIGNFNGENFPTWVMRMAVNRWEHRGILSPLQNLTGLKLVDCKRCRHLPTLGELPCLRYLYLDTLAVECIDDNFYVSSPNVPVQVLFPALKELHIWKFCNLIEWKRPPITIGSATFPCLEILEVMDCPLLENIPPLEYKSLRHLKVQEIVSVQFLDIISYSNNLVTLSMCEVSNLRSLPREVSNCYNLQNLNIWGCKELDSLPVELKFLKSLKILDIRGCHVLPSFPDDFFQGLSSLHKLNIFRCTRLTTIPSSLEGCTSTREMNIRCCPSLKAPLPDLSKLICIEELWVIDAGELRNSVSQALQHLSSLMELNIGGFKDEQEVEDYYTNMAANLSNQSPGLTRLLLEGYSNVRSLPEQIQHFCAIRILTIWKFDELEQLPDWIANLLSLEELALHHCKKLKFLPSQQVMLTLTAFWHLSIGDSPLLAQRCAKHNGPEWHNISHLSYIVIDSNIIQSKE